MRLTTLEIKGFKSFGDKVVIHFDKGVTSIVGPNGSGKSNVVDAMRWVLGEQKTRMLRSEKMENVIFNGNKSRKPSNMAEVSISFENTKNILPTEYSNVTITRRLYRSGDSEYLLNGVVCRLKDITDLFLDTGIGPDSYAIIELKMIDEILNDKNNAIKTLFEEAAGISKYKIRKKQTLSKLDETEADLNRVNDLMFEIERNLKTLESQARKTERYYKLKETYKDLSTELALFTIASGKVTFGELQEQETRLLEEKIALDTRIDESEAGLQKQKLYTLDKEKELSEAQKVLNEKINFIRQQENEKKISNEKLRYLQDKEQSLSTQLATDKSGLIETQDQIAVTEEEKFNEEQLLSRLSAQLQELKSVVDATHAGHDVLKSNVHRLTSEAQAIQLNMHESEKSYAVTQAKKDSLLKEIERLTFDTRNRQSELHELGDKSKAALESKETRENAYQSLLKEEESLQADSALLEEESKGVADELLDRSRKLDAKQNEYNLTRSLVENLEGYPESLRFLRKNASSTQTPLFSDILNCRSEYKSAIETYLEPFMNYFVIEDIEEASRAVNLLSEAAKGRANFFILKNFEGDSFTAPEEIGGCVQALQIIDTEPKYRALCQHLLKNVYIVTEDQDRTPFMQNGSLPQVFISQNGKYCKTRHSLSGGSVGMFDGKRMGRAKSLENLAREIETFSAELQEIKDRRDASVQELSRMRQQRDKIATDKNRLLQEVTHSTNEYSALHHKAEHLEVTVLNNNSIIADLNNQLLELDSTIEKDSLSHEEQLHALKAQYENVSGELAQMQVQFNEVVTRLNEQSAGYNNHHIQCIHQQNKIATLVRDLNYKFNLRETLAKNIELNAVELEKILEQVKDLLSHSTDFDAQLVNLYAEKDVLEKEVAVIEADYFKSRAQIDETEGSIRTIRHQKEQCEQLGQSVKDRTTELKIQLGSLKERLSAEFDIQLNDLMEKDPSPDWTEDELREKVNKQKSQLDNYGPINPMAIEAFTEIKERHTFITSQKEDLAKAKESLLQTIQEIEMTARENFMSAFTQVRENFIRVFRSLFSEEDNCDLRLLDPENPTESEIQIIAQPKGKRPLSISQLSGGEKTLTATALLFGIYLLKPAPFCIFDEVDAPLDDNNIDKFNNIIKKFSEESQFIIITHNKRTMAATDIMYGITMIEQGVTQVVPVDLAEMVE